MSYRKPTFSDREPSQKLTAAWVRASGHALNSVVEANRAALAAFGFTSNNSESKRSGSEPEFDRQPELDWSSERTVESPGELGLGDTVTFTKSIDDEDVLAFACATGDTNPLHLSNAFAEQSRFGGRVAHGTLVSGVVSAALARLPGLIIYLSQETQYLNPVELGDTVTAVVEVTEVLDEGRYRLSTIVTDDESSQIQEGEAVVLVDEPPNSG